MGVPFSSGMQWIFDQHQRFVRSGLIVYLRVKNFPEGSQNLEVGVPVAAASPTAGYTDFRIDPPPNVQDISMHNLGMAAQAGVRLNFGSKIFTISNTWVEAQIVGIEKDFGDVITDPYDIFRTRGGNGNVVGLVYQGRMHDISAITTRQAAGGTISWKIVGNAHEQPLTDAPETIST